MIKSMDNFNLSYNLQFSTYAVPMIIGEIRKHDGEGDGTPLQYSCLENPRDSGAWWAAVSGVAQSRTRLKRLSSSSRAVRQLEPREKNTMFSF